MSLIVRVLDRPRRLLFSLSFVLLTLAGVTGCGKSDSQPSDSKLQTQDSRPLLKFHWLGKQRLAAAPSATNLMAIWNLPESTKLEAQTLDKLATAPWRLWQTNTPASNAPTALLRPLLDDLVQAESYLEIQSAPNQPGELVLAIRLSAERDALWQTNLPLLLNSLSANSGDSALRTPDSALPDAASTFTLHTSHFTLQLSRSGDWTLLSLSDLRLQALDFSLLAQVRSRLTATQTPYLPRATNYVIEADADLSRVTEVLGLSLAGLPPARTARLVVFGDGETLRTRGWIDFSRPLALPLEPWNVPTNLIQAPLIGFSALRGVAPFLQSCGFWKTNELGAAPNQIYAWSQKSAPWLHFFAARSPEPGRQFLALKDYILDTVNLALAPNRTGDFAWLTNESRVVWKGVPFCSPVFEQQGDLILGGFVSVPPLRRPMPVEFLQQLHRGTNLVYYDWETTDAQVASWTQIAQLMRMAFSRAQLSIKDAGLPWLNTVSTNLSYSVTSVTLEDEHRLAFARAATLGLNSIELQLLVDWLDSPDFPMGFHTLVASREYVTDRTRPRR